MASPAPRPRGRWEAGRLVFPEEFREQQENDEEDAWTEEDYQVNWDEEEEEEEEEEWQPQQRQEWTQEEATEHHRLRSDHVRRAFEHDPNAET